MENIHQRNPYRLWLGNNLNEINRESAIELQKNSIYVSLLTGTDTILSTVYCLVGYYQLIFSVVISLAGYIGATMYNKYLIFAYMFNILFIYCF